MRELLSGNRRHEILFRALSRAGRRSVTKLLWVALSTETSLIRMKVRNLYFGLVQDF